jgi:hypothetical protein
MDKALYDVVEFEVLDYYIATFLLVISLTTWRMGSGLNAKIAVQYPLNS